MRFKNPLLNIESLRFALVWWALINFRSLLTAQGACNVDSVDSDCGCRTDSLGQGVSQIDQLKLALTWNRVDVAEEKIFTPDTDWPVREKVRAL